MNGRGRSPERDYDDGAVYSKGALDHASTDGTATSRRSRGRLPYRNIVHSEQHNILLKLTVCSQQHDKGSLSAVPSPDSVVFTSTTQQCRLSHRPNYALDCALAHSCIYSVPSPVPSSRRLLDRPCTDPNPNPGVWTLHYSYLGLFQHGAHTIKRILGKSSASELHFFPA